MRIFCTSRRAFVDLAHAHVAVDALDREVADVAVAAEHLDRGAADALGHLAGEQLGHRRFLQARLAGVRSARRVPDQLARRLDLRRHVGEPELHRLVLEDRLAEALALLRVARAPLRRRRAPCRRSARRCRCARLRGPTARSCSPRLPRRCRFAAGMRQFSKMICAVSLRMLAELVLEPRDDVAGRRRSARGRR